jgi:uncharacterized protein with ParB-like and HNH nuclease domain
MKADSLKISKVFSSGGDIHYVLPHFQREYSWERGNWDTLLVDAIAIHDEMQPATDEGHGPKELEHFLGSLVVINDGTRNGTVPAFKLVDGQQRLTTISLLLCALGRLVEASQPALAKKIQKLLINADEEHDVYFKVLPTTKYGDRLAYTAIIQGEDVPAVESRIPAAYEYLQSVMHAKIERGDIDPEKLFLALTNSFQVVFIDLNQNESPYRIFESLNAKGKSLTQADLVRNYIAMKLPAVSQEQVFSVHWSKIEELLQEKRTVGRSRLGELTAFLRHYLAMRTHVLCSEEHVYARFRDRIEKEYNAPDAFAAEIATLRKYAEYYNKLLRSEVEQSEEISSRLKRLSTLEASTAYPLLLAVYDSYSSGRLPADDFIKVLTILENYLLRRHLAGEPTNYLNKLFPTLWQQIDKERFTESLGQILASKNYPGDTKLRQRLLTRAMYDKSGLTRERTTLVLETINRHLSAGTGGFTVLDQGSTIEHILPQTPGPWWQAMLGPDWEEIHREYLHTLGNLTLVTQEWNSSLSNAPFPEKKDKLATHALRLNSDYFSQNIERWDANAIVERARLLTDKIIEIWPSLKEDKSEHEESKNYAEFYAGCIERVQRHLGQVLLRLDDVYYVSADKQCKVVCTVSKEYPREGEIEYWFGLQTAQRKFLMGAPVQYVAHGCGSPSKVMVIPLKQYEPLIENMLTTGEGDRRYWHVKIYEREGRFYLGQPLTGGRIEITEHFLR